jgi:peptidoglycan L-alanyl-D-glutamate endopeptidase CwlK
MASRKLTDLHPDLQPIAAQFMEQAQAAGIDVLVTCTWRSNEEQAQLYAQGRTVPGHVVTDAKPGQSRHNHMEDGAPAALAFDVVPLVAGKCDWHGDHPQWQKLGEIGQNLGLRWFGARGAPFPELPHFELPHAAAQPEAAPEPAPAAPEPETAESQPE